MITVRNKAELRAHRAQLGGQKVVFVPTMGALHVGHCQLLKLAREKAGADGIVVASLFVNPIQFDQKADFENYPNTLETDLAACEQEGVDVVFIPEAEEMYRKDASILVTESALSGTLCGATRKGHFDGVCTVVLKLYFLVQPDEMIFGKKDFQQVAVVQRMVRDLDVPVVITAAETVREASGLALSSRNRRLDAQACEEAPVVYATLQEVARQLERGAVKLSQVEACFDEAFSPLATSTRIDYLMVVHPETMQAVSEDYSGEAILAIAVFFGEIRLIDHVTLCV